MEVGSPDGLRFATIADDDLGLRGVADDAMVRLSEDGRPDDGYELEGARWSPDGRHLAVLRFDRRAVPRLVMPRWTEPGTPLESRPYSAAGQPIPQPSLHLFDVRAGTSVRVELGEAPYLHPAAWDPEGRELYLLRMNRLMNQLDLIAVDPKTGATRPILTERSETFLYGLPFLHGYAERLAAMRLVVPLADGARFLWTSEREGLRRVYLHRDDGELLRALSPAGLHIERVEHVDEAAGLVWFTASEPAGGRPYAQALYRVPLTGGEAELLFELPSLATLEFTRSGGFLLVLRAGLEQPLTLELRRADGTLVQSLWTADMRGFEELGWRPPQRFTAMAADGETPLHGILILPTDFDPERRYPVIEHIYAGPHTLHTPRAIWDRTLWTGQVLADAGYVVMMVDGRGTPGRGKAFQDQVHGRFGQFEIDDHAAVLRELAASRPYMDLERVGIWGHSWGGYFALRALLTRPEVYRVGVAAAPAVDPVNFRVSIEPYMGCLPGEGAGVYAAGANTALAGELRGRLLLVHGTRDDDVPFAETMRMADALIGAGKHFDLLVFPDATHVSFLGPYFQEAMLRFFGEHLGGGGR
jgi:dipeptidyl aminopeptidase/acylaminoacyl peptidase